jgi:hypothetical protein
MSTSEINPMPPRDPDQEQPGVGERPDDDSPLTEPVPDSEPMPGGEPAPDENPDEQLPRDLPDA